MNHHAGNNELSRHDLTVYLTDLLKPDALPDYCPHRLQVHGRARSKHIGPGVTASQALIEAAVTVKADAVLVHHGYFWKGEDACITGMKYRRIKRIMDAEINLYAYHLPLDVHPVLGNNSQLAKLMGWPAPQAVSSIKPVGVVMMSQLANPQSGSAIVQQLERQLDRRVTVAIHHERPIQRVAWCSGGGQGFIDQAAALGADLFISGEVSEQTTHSAREQGIDFIAAGHHATERYGVKALGEHLAERFKLTHQFIDVDNPA